MLFNIVIPTYNNLDELLICLESLEMQTVQDFHVFICIDGSTDNTIKYFSQNPNFNFSYSILQHPENKNCGRAATRNLALPFLNSQYTIFLDSDLYVQNDFLETHLTLLQKGNIISLGKIIYEKPLNVWANYLQSRGKNKYKQTQEIPYKYFENNAAMQTQQVFQCNGFDENIVTYGGEDTELGYRLWKKFQLKFYVNIQAIAFGRMNIELKEGLKLREEFAASGLKYIRKKHPEFDDIFQVKFLESKRATLLYKSIPANRIKQIINSNLFSSKLKNKLIHLLVFYYQYKGYHSNKIN